MKKVYRVKRFLGFTGSKSGTPKLIPIASDDIDAQMVIIDDENNGFNFNKFYWPLAIKSTEKSPIVIYKMNNPNGNSALWKQLEKFHLERTAQDFV